MILEVWSMGINSDQADPTLRPTYAVYNRMGLLLKSLISVTRVTPAYKLSRRQSSDSYNIYYRMYVGDPQVHNLGMAKFDKFLFLFCVTNLYMTNLCLKWSVCLLYGIILH